MEGSEIHIRTDHASLSVYRQKKPMTRRLGKFMEEIEHYDPQIGYRPGRLQTVPDALSCISGQRETGDPASTDRFFEMEEGEEASDTNVNDNADNDSTSKPASNDTPAQSMRPKIRHNTDYFHQITRYHKAKLAER